MPVQVQVHVPLPTLVLYIITSPPVTTIVIFWLHVCNTVTIFALAE